MILVKKTAGKIFPNACTVLDMLEVPACLDCGTCCFSTLLEYVGVSGDDYERMGERAEELTHFAGNRVFMTMRDGHCGALRLIVGTRQFVCDAYAIRPTTCRDLARGESACLGELETKGERPLVALGRAISAASSEAR